MAEPEQQNAHISLRSDCAKHWIVISDNIFEGIECFLKLFILKISAHSSDKMDKVRQIMDAA